MILVFSYIGLMLMLGSRQMYGHLTEIFFQVDWRAGGSCILCDDSFIMTWAIAHIPLRFGIRSLNIRDF